MILSIQTLKPEQRQAVRALSTMRPVPQQPALENMARLMAQNGCTAEACFVLDFLASHYGRQAGKISAQRVFNIRTDARGRGITAGCGQKDHPTLFALRDFTAPLQIGRKSCLRCGDNIMLASPESSEFTRHHAVSQNPSAEPILSVMNRPVQWISYRDCLIIADGSNTLTVVDLCEIPDQHAGMPLYHAHLTFESAVRGLCGPLNDGTFFITLEPPIPVLSDTCRLCRIDIDMIREKMRADKGRPCDVREAGAVRHDILMPNVEQTLRGDCTPAGDYFMTCGGGMQNREVRFISGDGSWTTRFVHESPVICIIPSEKGPVSIGEDGHAFLWNDRGPADDMKFAAHLVPPVFKDHKDDVLCSIDWTHRRLYMTLTQNEPSSLGEALRSSHSCCLTDNSANIDAFIKMIYHLSDMTLAMLADGSIHFWDIRHDCVDARWQLSKACAEQADWLAVLSVRSPAVDEDPRIRKIDWKI